MSDFAAELRAYVAGQADAAAARSAVDPTEESRVIAWRVRRRRATRTATVVVAAAAVVLVAAAGVFAATRPDPVPPAETRTPTVTPVRPTPTPTPTPTLPSATPAVAAESPVTVHPYLPAVSALPDGLLAQTGQDWLLIRYQAWGPPVDDGWEWSPVVLYLRDPSGALYEVPLPDEIRASGEWSVVDWVPGTARALVWSYAGDGFGLFVVDLATGATTAFPGASGAAYLAPGGVVEVMSDGGATTVRLLDDAGAVRGSVGPFQPVDPPATDLTSAGWALNPSRTRLLVDASDGLRLYDLTDGVRELSTAAVHQPGPPDGWCTAEAWLDDDRFTLACNQWHVIPSGGEGLGDELYVVDLAAGASTLVAGGRETAGGFPILSYLTSTWNLQGSVLTHSTGLGQGWTCGAREVSRIDGATHVALPVPGLTEVRAVAGGLVFGVVGCAPDSRWAVFDPVTGAEVVLVPRVERADGDDAQPVLPSGTRARFLW